MYMHVCAYMDTECIYGYGIKKQWNENDYKPQIEISE